MTTGIYKITNKINGKSYIGQSVFIERRWKNEKSAAFNSLDNEYNCSRSKAFRKYGLDNFIFEVIEECDKNKLNEREIYWINYYNSYYDGYNETLGGENAITTSKITEKDLDKIIQMLKENILSEQDIAEQTGYSIGTISEINQGHIWRKENLSYPLRNRINQSIHTCPYCGRKINKNAKICAQCLKNQTFNFQVPSKQELTNLLYQYKGNLSAIGRIYGISKNPIKRLVQEYQLEDLIKSIKNPIIEKKMMKVIDDIGNVFDSPADANRYYNTAHVKEVCDGKRKSTAGHIFKWID